MHALAFSLFCVMPKQWTMYVTERVKAMICTIVLRISLGVDVI